MAMRRVVMLVVVIVVRVRIPRVVVVPFVRHGRGSF
jgi:hypothetical protein